MGSAVAYVCAEALLLYLTRRLVLAGIAPLSFWEHAWKPLLTSGPMVLLLYMSQSMPLYARIAAGFAVYVFSGLIFRTIDPREIASRLFPATAAQRTKLT
jgi:hypothetical protein